MNKLRWHCNIPSFNHHLTRWVIRSPERFEKRILLSTHGTIDSHCTLGLSMAMTIVLHMVLVVVLGFGTSDTVGLDIVQCLHYVINLVGMLIDQFLVGGFFILVVLRNGVVGVGDEWTLNFTRTKVGVVVSPGPTVSQRNKVRLDGWQTMGRSLSSRSKWGRLGLMVQRRRIRRFSRYASLSY